MGYQIEPKIAKITEPTGVSLMNSANFIEFERLDTSDKDKLLDVTLEVVNSAPTIGTPTFTIQEGESLLYHTFKGVTQEEMDEIDEPDNYTFLLNKDLAQTAENVKLCMLQHTFFRENFHITTNLGMEGGELKKNNQIRIVSKGYGRKYSMHLSQYNNWFIIIVEGDFTTYQSPDSILNEDENCEIQIDIYKDAEASAHKNDFNNLGTYITTLSKAYYGQPLWFDINTIWANQNMYSKEFLESANKGWVSSGTARDFRFAAKKYNGLDSQTFYCSDVLYTISGYKRNLDKADLSPYIYTYGKESLIQPLTTRAEFTHISGQRQYFNFIMHKPEDKKITEGVEIGIQHKVYTQSGYLLGSVTERLQPMDKFAIVNTLQLDIDTILDAYPKAGIVKSYLCKVENKATTLLSEPMVFSILPDCIYKVRDFAFLNSLGGWSSFNFGGTEQVDFKADATTIHRTQTPNYTKSDQILSVFRKDITEQIIVQTTPINAQTAEWLKELSASVAVYELSTDRYIIVDELNVKYNTKDDLFSLQMKYRYSDSYNAG